MEHRRGEAGNCKIQIGDCALQIGLQRTAARKFSIPNLQSTICNSPKAEVAVAGIKRFVDAAAH
jgi:hypothetical protein